MAENVRVAVRVRPFNQREMNRGAKVVIHMNGTSTYIKDPVMTDAEPKKFSFDYSYWSHDGYSEDDSGYLCADTPRYADQQTVFDDLGRGVLDNAWKGYNCSLFAYGQTGSGKSYSMVGYGANKGIVPVTCDELFKGIEEKVGSGIEFQVVLSMLEIYNEQVRDLLNPAANLKGGLKIREHPNRGFYVDNLCSMAVKNYKEIEERIAEGTKNRTIASTNMNATSSRAHTIVAVTFTQKSKNEVGQNMSKTSVINLVDLAGSERADSTGATGARLQEGAAINKSLSTLGNVIKALADASSGKKALVPFRDSSLTKLLKNALGGNSKTIMIAALSPADINYDETLSTLRFADRAKSIKTKAIVNESPTDKLIRELREENAKLMSMIKKGNFPQMSDQDQLAMAGASEEEVERMRKQMEEEMAINLDANKREMEELQKTWEQKLAESKTTNLEKDRTEGQKRALAKTTPHFWNLNEDPQLTNMVVHLVRKGANRIGNNKADPPPEILINGLSTLQEHAVAEDKRGDAIMLSPCGVAKILLNGSPLTGKTALHHNDRVLFGSNHLYIFHHPAELAALVASGEKPQAITYDFAQGEMASSSGFDMTTEGKSKEDILLQEDLIKLMPMIYEANAMSEELNKQMVFEIILVSPQARGLKAGRTEVKVKMRSLSNDHSWLWGRGEFLDRKYRMQELYQNYMEGGSDWNQQNEQDPFWAHMDVEVMIGSVHVYLQSLSYMIELEEQLVITDYKGNEQGHLQVEVLPCNGDGSPLKDGEDMFVEEPSELMGSVVNFAVKIVHARGIPTKYTKEVYCKYRFYRDTEDSATKAISNTRNPNFNFNHHYSINPVTKAFLSYLSDQTLLVEVWGKQVETSGQSSSSSSSSSLAAVTVVGKKPLTSALTTTELVKREAAKMGNSAILQQLTLPHKDDGRQHQLMAELSAAKRKAERVEGKMRKIRKLLERAEKQKLKILQVEEVKRIISAEKPSFKTLAKMVALSNQAAKMHNTDGSKVQSAACSIM